MSDAQACLPPWLGAGDRAWGFALNLYTLRSKRNWGIGDFSDLRAFVRIAAGFGASYVGLNPLHALHPLDPAAASPYAPSSRFFLNPLYIDVAAVPEYRRISGRHTARERLEHKSALAELRATPHVMYERVAAQKQRFFRELFEAFQRRDDERRARFEAFVAAGGARLERFARYEALDEFFAAHEAGLCGWLNWPSDYHDPAGGAVQTFAERERPRVAFHQYLQWIADEQLRAAAREARTLGVRLYRDLAVGVDRNGADVWSDQGAYVLGETIGAPPDPLGPAGQNWGLPPPDPAVMSRDDAREFAALLRANMRHAGALRLDHAMALTRLFRIPEGRPAAEGAYVAYPLETLLGATARESERAHCLVIGEDLGNVPDGFRERMERARILSYRLLLFEREGDGRFKPPQAYPRLALATAVTHDLPTLRGWLTARDVAVREEIGLIDGPTAERARSERRLEVERFLDALTAHGGLGAEEAARMRAGAGEPDLAALRAVVAATYRYLADTPSALVLVQLDDALLERDQVNLPGTFDEYPNWRRKLSVDLDDIEGNASVGLIAAEMRRIVGGIRLA